MLIEQRGSLVGTVSRKLRKAIHAVRVERFYVLTGPPNIVPTAIPCELRSFTTYTAEAARLLTSIKGFEVDWKRRFDLGHRCYVTFCDQQPAGYGWVATGSWLLGVEAPLGPLAPDVAFIYDEITLEPYRGKRLGPARLSFMARDMARQGFARSCQLIADDNYASQRSALAAGYRPSASVVRVHRLALRFRFPQGAPPSELRIPQYSPQLTPNITPA